MPDPAAAPFSFRPAVADDRAFLIHMLVEAVTADLSREQVLAEPRLRRYVENWPRPGDAGLVMVGAGEPQGAVWWRLFPGAEPGYGYVADDVPELSIALAPVARGRGIGRALLRAALAEVALRHRRVSLSANRENPARALYVSEGFRKVGEVGDSDVMLKVFG